MNQEHDENVSMITTLSERIFNGVIKENPTFVLLLGMCPTLAVTTSAINGLGMGVTTMIVLALSNLFISALRKIIPDKVRIPAFIVIIASFVTIVELLLKAYIPSLYSALGLYIPLIVVNCIILGRAEAYASKNPPLPSLFDGLGMGMGFTFALTIIGSVRELLGSGKLFNYTVMPKGFVPVSIFVMAPGAFFVLAVLTAIQNKIKIIGTRRGKDMSKIQSGCGGNCLECTKECKDRTEKEEPVNEEPVVEKPVVSGKVAEEPFSVETINEEPVKEEPAFAEPVKEEPIVEEPEIEEPVKEEPAKEEPVKEESIPENVDKEESIKEEPIKDEPVKEEPVSEKTKPATDDDDFDEELILLDLNDYKKAISKTSQKSRRAAKAGKSAKEKAAAMFFKAEESLKEGEDD